MPLDASRHAAFALQGPDSEETAEGTSLCASTPLPKPLIPSFEAFRLGHGHYLHTSGVRLVYRVATGPMDFGADSPSPG